MADEASPSTHADLPILLDVARELGATIELPPLLGRIMDAATSVLGCERATVFLYDPDTDELYSRLPTEAGVIRFPAQLGIAGQAFQTGEIIRVADAYADERFNPGIDRATGFRTRNLLTFPLRGHNHQIIGALQVLNRRAGDFGPREEELAGILSSLAGVALQRQMLLDEYAAKQKLDRDMGLARDIQQSLLPRQDPSPDGYDLAGFNCPADATGGDCYDYLLLGDDKIGLVLADASGHGIGPALVVSQFRAMVRALASADRTAESVLERVNALIYTDLPDGIFVTAFLGRLDLDQHEIRYASAGQGPLLHYCRAEDQIRTFGADRVPLGILLPLDGEEPDPVKLAPGDLFVVMTDGFFEWANADGEHYGIQRINDLIRASAGCSARALLDQLYTSVKAFTTPMPQHDDLTAIVVRRHDAAG